MPPPGPEQVERKLRELEALYRYGRRSSALRVAVASIGVFLSAALLWSTALNWTNPPSADNFLGLVALDPYESTVGAGAWWAAAALLVCLVLSTLTAASCAWGMAAATAVIGLAALVAEIVLWLLVSREGDVVGPGLIAAACITFALVVWATVSALAIHDLGPDWAVTYNLDQPS